MGLPHYLAMTPEEFATSSSLPEHIAWMSCRFSPDGNGLMQVPTTLPTGSILVLDDAISPKGQDPAQIMEQLKPVLKGVCGLLLDFQKPDNPETATLAKALVQLQLCPTGVSEPYAQALDCPVFLPPVPLHRSVEEYLAPYAGREIWLDTVPGMETILITSEGMKYMTAMEEAPGKLHHDSLLHCHYRTTVTEHDICFSLFRTVSDEADFLKTAAELGVTRTFGLYQEYQNK